jgi:hypothetical protein
LADFVQSLDNVRRVCQYRERSLRRRARQHTAATFLFKRTDPTFQRPSTLARAGNSYLVVNADFTTSTPPFTLTGLPRQ